MILHLIESGRHRGWLNAPTLWSAAAHATLVGSLVVASPPAVDAATGATQEVVFFLPLLPKVPPQESAVDLQWNGAGKGAGTGVPLPIADRGTLPPVRDGGGRALPVQVEEAGPPVDGSPVFLASELDQEVERDPASAGPSYPEVLRATNTEGSVVAEWIVDTTGTADSTSFRIVSSTHPLFTESVRACLTGMRFRPAELNGQRVRQLVRQEFRFRLELPIATGDSVKPPTTGRKKKG